MRKELLFYFWKERHTPLNYPLKDKIELHFYKMCDLGDYLLEDFPKAFENILNEKIECTKNYSKTRYIDFEEYSCCYNVESYEKKQTPSYLTN